jgi:hypothetical protein
LKQLSEIRNFLRNRAQLLRNRMEKGEKAGFILKKIGKSIFREKIKCTGEGQDI